MKTLKEYIEQSEKSFTPEEEPGSIRVRFTYTGDLASEQEFHKELENLKKEYNLVPDHDPVGNVMNYIVNPRDLDLLTRKLQRIRGIVLDASGE